jgi:O-acetyl-ADP-ribose deacetylase (regulator of RNase III)
MGSILHHVTGNATDPVEDVAVIAHVCNNIGAWGAGFVVALSAADRTPELRYRNWNKTKQDPQAGTFELGAVQFVPYRRPGLYVANMIAQQGVRHANGRPPIRYNALETCLAAVAEFAAIHDATLVGPRFGSGLAGGRWQQIENMAVNAATKAGIHVVIYTPERKPHQTNPNL